MLEQAIERLTVEVQKLREAIEKHTARLDYETKKENAVDARLPPPHNDAFLKEQAVADLASYFPAQK